MNPQAPAQVKPARLSHVWSRLRTSNFNVVGSFTRATALSGSETEVILSAQGRSEPKQSFWPAIVRAHLMHLHSLPPAVGGMCSASLRVRNVSGSLSSVSGNRRPWRCKSRTGVSITQVISANLASSATLFREHLARCSWQNLRQSRLSTYINVINNLELLENNPNRTQTHPSLCAKKCGSIILAGSHVSVEVFSEFRHIPNRYQIGSHM